MSRLGKSSDNFFQERCVDKNYRMRVNDDYETVNAEVQRKQNDPDKLSVLQFWKRGLANRKEHKDVFVYGNFELLDEHHTKVFSYKRASESEAFVVTLNFSNDEIQWEVPKQSKVKSWVAGNYTAGKPDKATSGTITLKPWEGLLGKLRGCRRRRIAANSGCRHC